MCLGGASPPMNDTMEAARLPALPSQACRDMAEMTCRQPPRLPSRTLQMLPTCPSAHSGFLFYACRGASNAVRRFIV